MLRSGQAAKARSGRKATNEEIPASAVRRVSLTMHFPYSAGFVRASPSCGNDVMFGPSKPELPNAG